MLRLCEFPRQLQRIPRVNARQSFSLSYIGSHMLWTYVWIHIRIFGSLGRSIATQALKKLPIMLNRFKVLPLHGNFGLTDVNSLEKKKKIENKFALDFSLLEWIGNLKWDVFILFALITFLEKPDLGSIGLR